MKSAKEKLLESIEHLDIELTTLKGVEGKEHIFLLLKALVDGAMWSEQTYEEFLVASVPLAIYFFKYENTRNYIESGIDKTGTQEDPRTWEEYKLIAHLIANSHHLNDDMDL
ncbi:hypothetical protein G7B40_001585 [Aetokthonos hydrillicola Thurmond2011]|jgi:hypothetical protein|uniref:Uncharacterized protein n=1 Tax=Aetokthonos hydrillicola Thurmond2011 TaxID=2712845 RepID=A0AAP5I556_9CYAN|nr:hypothetical protein [Aetokthonos hydrillicola]MBO3463575.1 hypothetical protein [Aetokthonos hydrillicola CCALA 1050]MDR9893278.1 hypothetical protein [Aetokthonos hydrillicola Thurmond2011]